MVWPTLGSRSAKARSTPATMSKQRFDFVEATFDFVSFDNVCFDTVAGVDGV